MAPAAPSGIERRRSVREKLVAPAVLQPSSGDASVDRGVQVQDLSLGGVGFVATEKFDPGEVYRITLGKGPLLLNARVRIISCNKTCAPDVPVRREFVLSPVQNAERTKRGGNPGTAGYSPSLAVALSPSHHLQLKLPHPRRADAFQRQVVRLVVVAHQRRPVEQLAQPLDAVAQLDALAAVELRRSRTGSRPARRRVWSKPCVAAVEHEDAVARRASAMCRCTYAPKPLRSVVTAGTPSAMHSIGV